jgi:hypothetical protein
MRDFVSSFINNGSIPNTGRNVCFDILLLLLLLGTLLAVRDYRLK